MFIDRILFLDPVPHLMEKSLDFNSARHLLLSSNISNLDTPGYRAQDLDFKEQLGRALLAGGRAVEVPSTLRARTEGRSKMRVLPAALGHLGTLGRLAWARLTG